MPAPKQTSANNSSPLHLEYGNLMQTLLDEVQEGVIACEYDGTVALFNRAATGLFNSGKSIGRGVSLYNLCLQAPVEHALQLLDYRKKRSPDRSPQASSVQFINTTADNKRFFRCRLNTLDSSKNGGFVIFFEDITTWYRPDNLLFMKIEKFRGPMTNLRAAVENLTEHPEMSPVMRSAFENVLVQESLNLTEAFASLDKVCNSLIQTQSHLTELSPAVLFGFITDRFTWERVTFETIPGRAGAVRVDFYGFLLVLQHLAGKIVREKKLTEVHCKAHAGTHFVYFDFFWPGKFMPTATVESLLQEKIKKSVGDTTVAAILHSMGGDIWSQQHDSSRSILRLALPLVPNPAE